MFFPIAAVIAGLVLLVWSADKFVEGSAAVARHFGMPSLLIGMIIVGFGTSVPEMLVSAISSLQGNPGIALGNAYGSNITNIALILGATAIMSPIAFHISVMKIELPILTAVSLFAAFQLIDGEITRIDAFLMIAVFTVYMTWAVRKALHHKKSKMAKEYEKDIEQMKMPVKKSIFLGFCRTFRSDSQFKDACMGCCGNSTPFRCKRPDNRTHCCCNRHIVTGTGIIGHGGKKG